MAPKTPRERLEALKTPRARLDADRTATPKTRLLGHGQEGHCLGPETIPADTLENLETGERTSLTSPVSSVSWCDKTGLDPNGKPYTHGSFVTHVGCPECRGVPMVRTDVYGNRDPNGSHWTSATAARDAQPQPEPKPAPVDPKDKLIKDLARLVQRCEPFIYENERLDKLHGEIEAILIRPEVLAALAVKS